MDYGKNIAGNIKRLRKLQHVTQEQLANAVGISYQAVILINDNNCQSIMPHAA